jgi:hypothetical protein
LWGYSQGMDEFWTATSRPFKDRWPLIDKTAREEPILVLGIEGHHAVSTRGPVKFVVPLFPSIGEIPTEYLAEFRKDADEQGFSILRVVTSSGRVGFAAGPRERW